MVQEIMPNKMVKKDYLIIRILYFIRYFGDAMFYSFFQLFLSSKGLLEGDIGIILAITPITALVINPFWNILSKDVNINRRIMKWITVFEGIIIILFTQISGFELIALLTAMLAIVGSPFYSLMDGFTGTFTTIHKKNYSLVRILGSIAYVFGTAIGGIFIEHISFTFTFMVCGVIFILCSLIVRIISPIDLQNVQKENKKRDYKKVLLNKGFIFYSLFYITTVSLSVIGDNFFGVFLQNERGVSSQIYGFICSAMVIAEVIAMLVIAKIGDKVKEKYLFIIAGLIYAVRWLAIALNLPTNVIMAFALFRGFAWGTILAIHLKFLVKIVKLENLTTAIFILAIAIAIFQSIFNIVCGKAINFFGYQHVFIIFTCIIAFSTIVFYIINQFGFFKKMQ